MGSQGIPDQRRRSFLISSDVAKCRDNALPIDRSLEIDRVEFGTIGQRAEAGVSSTLVLTLEHRSFSSDSPRRRDAITEAEADFISEDDDCATFGRFFLYAASPASATLRPAHRPSCVRPLLDAAHSSPTGAVASIANQLSR